MLYAQGSLFSIFEDFEGHSTFEKHFSVVLLKLEEASSLPRLDVCLMKKMT